VATALLRSTSNKGSTGYIPIRYRGSGYRRVWDTHTV
jgi:hypothetical protein